MSKERELLRRCLIADKNGTMSIGLIKDIKELLAQPEQEPLTDASIDKAYFESCGNYYDLVFKDGVRWAEAQHNIGVDDEDN